MTRPTRWLAVLATGGALAGGAAAVATAGSPSLLGEGSGLPAASAASAQAPKDKVAAEVELLLRETRQLQGALAKARSELVIALSHPGGRTIVYQAGSAGASSTQLAGEAASLAAERARLEGEAATLEARQKMLSEEAAGLAAEAKKLAATPSTHGSTGASSGSGDGGGGDN